MNTGDIILLPFPFAELNNKKVRPGVFVCETADKYKDVVVCAISSVIPTLPGANEILLRPDRANMLRSDSVIRIDRIVTVKSRDVIARIGKLDDATLEAFREKFRRLVD